jgi:hypothetical protein
MKIRTRKSQHLLTVIIWCVGLLIAASAIIIGYRYAMRDTSPIPAAIRSQLTFSPFILTDNTKAYTTSDYKFNTAEANVHILSYVIHTKDVTITVSQYTQPSEFSEIPEYKDRFLSNVIKQYGTVQTSNGTVYLGRLPRQGNKQLALMIEKGLLVLMSPSRDIDEAQWRNLGDQLEVQKIINNN